VRRGWTVVADPSCGSCGPRSKRWRLVGRKIRLETSLHLCWSEHPVRSLTSPPAPAIRRLGVGAKRRQRGPNPLPQSGTGGDKEPQSRSAPRQRTGPLALSIPLFWGANTLSERAPRPRQGASWCHRSTGRDGSAILRRYKWEHLRQSRHGCSGPSLPPNRGAAPRSGFGVPGCPRPPELR